MKKYQIKYKDSFGEEQTEIATDGSMLYFTLRGVEFEGIDFESLEGEVDIGNFQYEMYQDGSGYLTNFELIVIIPIDIVREGKEIIENLIAFVATGSGKSIVRLKLETEYGIVTGKKEYGYFEDAIIEIQKKLPKNTKIKTCLSCKYSNYHPVGNVMFGGLNCFKDVKEDLEKVYNKYDLMKIWDKGIENKDTFNVQETFVCEDHKFVTKHDWVYKNWT